ncbi:MAG: carbonic anhydrase [bacterium]
MGEGSFVTAINCMDGRTQLPVIEWLRREFGAEYVDSVTEPGPIRQLAEEPRGRAALSMLARVAISVNRHGSRTVAVVAHDDCAGNPEPKEVQLEQLRRAVDTVMGWGLEVEVVGVWLGSEWQVERVL